jgi:hypothetical protein
MPFEDRPKVEPSRTGCSRAWPGRRAARVRSPGRSSVRGRSGRQPGLALGCEDAGLRRSGAALAQRPRCPRR